MDILPFVMNSPAVTAGCLLALALTGCSSDASTPAPLPPVASASPSPTALSIPPEAQPETAEGAAAFARYYLALVNEAFTFDDATAVRAVSDPGCGTCTNLIGAIEHDATPGERVDGGDFEVVFAESPPVEQGDVIVDVRYNVTEVRVLSANGTVLETTPARLDVDGQIRLLRTGESWRVAGFRNVTN